MKTCVENLKIVKGWSSAAIWFEFVPIPTFDEDPEDLFIFLNIIDKRKNKKEHFCSSGSSEDTREYTTSNLITAEGLMTWSSKVFRIFSSHVGR